MALKKCLKHQRTQLNSSRISANHIFLLKISKFYLDLLDKNFYFQNGRRPGVNSLNERLVRFILTGKTIKRKVHYRHGLKFFSTEGL